MLGGPIIDFAHTQDLGGVAHFDCRCSIVLILVTLYNVVNSSIIGKDALS